MFHTATADWILGQTLILQGVRPKEVAKQLGISRQAVVSMSKKRGWGKVALRLAQDSIARVKPEELGAVSVVPGSEIDVVDGESVVARRRLSSELLSSLAHLGTMPHADELKDEASRAGILSSLASTAERIYGWDAEAGRSGTVINIGVVEQSIDQRSISVGDQQNQPQVNTIDIVRTNVSESEKLVSSTPVESASGSGGAQVEPVPGPKT